VRASQKAVSLTPDYVKAHNNMGTALMELERFIEAEKAFQRAMEIDPECAEAHLNLSLILMLQERFSEGWVEYEWRWKDSLFSTPKRNFPYLWWKGTTHDVGKLLLWGEQGVGDEVQFAGFIKDIAARGVSVVVECDRRLVRLLQRSFPDAMIEGRTNPPDKIIDDPCISHQLPMTSIPRILGVHPRRMTLRKAYLVPDEEMAGAFHMEYRQKKSDRLIGISWRSGNKQEGSKRSIGLESWGPIFKTPKVRFVNLQYGECTHELELAEKMHGVSIINDQRVDPMKNLDVFAGQVAAMDLVISADISTVHFAGALGVDVWTMLPTVPDWRWGLEGEYTFWYATMRLFRQKQRGEWGFVISRVAEELAAYVSSVPRHRCSP
jgi:hypothetical protein